MAEKAGSLGDAGSAYRLSLFLKIGFILQVAIGQKILFERHLMRMVRDCS